MAKVKRKKDLTHSQKQFKRSMEYKDLMKVKIPTKPMIFKDIHPEFWYVIWEKALLNPRILKYTFRSKYFATKYCEKTMVPKKYRHNILQGQDLIAFGFDRARQSMRELSGDKRQGAQKYIYPEELSRQRRKTLRTMYRRNLRRILLKLMEYGK